MSGQLLAVDAMRVLFAGLTGAAALFLVRRTSVMSPPRRRWDVLVVVVAAVTSWWVGAAVLAPPTAVLLPLIVAGQAAAMVDAREGRLPDALTLPLAAATLLATALTATGPVRALVAATIAGVAALLLKTCSDAAIGWGDVKLAPSVGIVLDHFDAVGAGLRNIVLLVFGTALVLAVAGRRSVGGVVPYGPALVLGTLGATVEGG